jgi:CubicO group peptidase (beta-lactamase class C family)
MKPAGTLEAISLAADLAVDELLSRYQVPGAAVVAVHGGEIAMKLYGVERRNGAPVTAASRFSCGSTSKAFVSALGAVLHAKKLICWDDPVIGLVPEWQMPQDWQRSVTTYRDLCGNRTGVSRRGVCEYGADLDLPISRTFARLRHTPVVAAFREHFSYLNLGFTAAATGFGRAAGLAFQEALRTELLTPLGMHDTLAGIEASPRMEGLCGWHREQDGEIIEISPRLSGANELGASGILTSARDAATWLAFQLGSKSLALPHDLASRTHQPVSIIPPAMRDPSYATDDSLFASYALGWSVSELEGRRIIRHGGNDPGMSAHVALAPDDALGVAVYLNRNSKYCALECSYSVLGTLLGIDRDWRAMLDEHFADEHAQTQAIERLRRANNAPVAGKELERYAGYYDCAYSGPAHVFVADDRLNIRFAMSRYHSGWLKPVGEEHFLLIGTFDCNEGTVIDEVKFTWQDRQLVMDAGWAGDFTRLAPGFSV